VLPSTLAELVRLRTGHFDGEVGDMLLAACSVTDATVESPGECHQGVVERVVELLEGPEPKASCRSSQSRDVRASTSGTWHLHPGGPGRRRRMHRTLAVVEVQPELKARHMALGAASAEPDTLHALDDAAAAAVARGAAAAAADLYGLAIGLGGDTPARRLSAAEQHFRSGDTRRAGVMLEAAVTDFGPGPLRATALTLLGATRLAEHDYAGALVPLTEAADEAGDDLGLLVRAQLSLSRAKTMTGRHEAARRQASWPWRMPRGSARRS